MSHGTLGGMAISQHIPTPAAHAARLPYLVSQRPGQPISVGDLCGCGAGNLLAAFASDPTTTLFGIEISADRAAAAQARLPHATIVRAPFEATRPSAGAFSLCVANPPYVRLDDGRRAEYAALLLITRALAPSGVVLLVLPARSGLDGALINHLARYYAQLRAWRFPDGDPDDDEAFQKYSQIVVAAVKRSIPLETPDPTSKAQLLAWRYESATASWAGGSSPPILPAGPLADPYPLPSAPSTPEILVQHADDATLLDALATSGVQHSPAWREAVTLTARGTLARPLMPPTGPAHLAALILSGLLDGDILDGPNGQRLVLTTATTKQATPVPLDAELAAKGVVEVTQIEDHPTLRVLDLASGAVQTCQGEAAFTFLQPLLGALTAQVLARHQPVYALDPQDWELRVAAQIGRDKQLPGADQPGLAPAQLHRVCALRQALGTQRRALFAGEPGVGKTRQLIALLATLAHAWQHPMVGQPPWMRRLRRCWRANARTLGNRPRALPVWISAPKRVLPTWQREIAGAWPNAEVLVVRDHTDVDRWLARCTTTTAPVVVALIAHSTKAATGLRWQPAVLAQTATVAVPDVAPPAALQPTLEPVVQRGRVVAYRDRVTGAVRMTTAQQTTFRCPDCHARVEARPQRSQRGGDDDTVELVTSLTYFTTQRRWCAACGAALWSVVKTEARERRYPHTPFAAWSRAVDARIGQVARSPQRLGPDGTLAPVCPDSFSPAQYAYQRYRGCVALSIIDESHNGRGAATDLAQAHHFLMLSAQCRILASGTHTGGELRHLFHYLFRYHPPFWRRLGLAWGDVDAAVARYGVVQERVTEHEHDARKGSGAVDRTTATIEVPGISATLLPHVLGELITISVLDVGSAMPPLVEIPILVDMHDPTLAAHVATARAARDQAQAALEQARDADDPAAVAAATDQVTAARTALTAAQAWADARDLAGHYQEITNTLDTLAQQRNQAAQLATGSVPRWWSVLPMSHHPSRSTRPCAAPGAMWSAPSASWTRPCWPRTTPTRWSARCRTWSRRSGPRTATC